jgi:hypothetical protein
MKNEKKLENYFDKINIKILEQFRKIILLLAISLINLARATKERTTHLLNPKKKRSVKTINSDFFGKKIIAGISLIIIASFFISDASATVIRGFDEVRFNGVLLLNATTALDFITNGVTRMYLDSSGNLGIGTTSSNHSLAVEGNTSVSEHLYVGGDLVSMNLTTGVIGGEGTKWTLSGSSIYYNDGNVGIGTTSPVAKLEIHGAGDYIDTGASRVYPLELHSTDNTNYALLMGIEDGSPGFGWLQAGNPGSAIPNLVLGPEGGNVGIGTTAPAYELEVIGNITSNGTIIHDNEVSYFGDSQDARIYFNGGNLIIEG